MYRISNALNEQILKEEISRYKSFCRMNKRTQKCVRLLQRLLQMFFLMLYQEEMSSFTRKFSLKLISKLNKSVKSRFLKIFFRIVEHIKTVQLFQCLNKNVDLLNVNIIKNHIMKQFIEIKKQLFKHLSDDNIKFLWFWMIKQHLISNFISK